MDSAVFAHLAERLQGYLAPAALAHLCLVSRRWRDELSRVARSSRERARRVAFEHADEAMRHAEEDDTLDFEGVVLHDERQLILNLFNGQHQISFVGGWDDVEAPDNSMERTDLLRLQEFALALKEAVGANKLTSLVMHSSPLGKLFAPHLWRCVEGHPTLREICLSSCNIQCSEAKLIADALKKNRSVRNLNLANNHLLDDGAVSVGDALSVNASIASLFLDGNRIFSRGTSGIAEGLSRNSTIQMLSMSNNPMGNEGAAHLSSALASTHSLSTLLLKGKLTPPLTPFLLLFVVVGGDGH